MSVETATIVQVKENLRALMKEMEVEGIPTHLIKRVAGDCNTLQVLIEEERAKENRIISRLQGSGNHKPAVSAGDVQ